MRLRINSQTNIAVFLALLVHPALGADWPMYRADAARSGYCSDPLPEELELRWVHRSCAPSPAWPHSARISYDFANQPIVVRDTVIFGTSTEDAVVALDAATGRLHWKFFTGGPVPEGVPEDFMKIANEKMSEINQAYDEICKERGI